MTPTRTRLLRMTLPVAAAMLALAACSSTSSESSTSDDAVASTMASEEMESDAMASAEMTPHSDDAKSDDAMSDDAMSGESTSDDGMADDAMTGDEAMAEQAGAFIDYADYEGNKGMYDNGTVVLFFNATWCPTCKETTKNLEADPAAIPAGLTVVSVDFDSSDELKQKYGITTQHTFVQVDADGNELAKWTGSATADEIAKQTA
jgi:thiol-disulfide isomerase/thioredoxin